jgi:OOP family OmpA-OmpF porin
MGIGIGQSSIDISDPYADRIDDTDTSLKIFGGAEINPNFAVEFGYINFGEVSAHYPLYDETDRFEGSALFAAAVGQVNVTEQLRLFGKMGLNFWKVDVSANATYLGSPVSGSGDGTGMSILFGVGVSFKASNQLSIRLEWEQYQNVGDGVDLTAPGYGSIEIDGEDVQVVGAALIYNF